MATRRLRGQRRLSSTRNKSNLLVKKELYAAIDTKSKLLPGIDLYSRFGTGPTTAFLHRSPEKHDVSDAEFLIDAGGYLIAPFRHDLSGRPDYRERNQIKKLFQTVSILTNRFHLF